MNLGVPALVGALFLVSWTAPLTAVAANTAPRISGAPATSVRAFEQYNFRPVARDADRQRLRFAIANKPPWASFDRTTGRLYGTPKAAYAGITFGAIRISVSDGITRRYLPGFSIAVKPANRAPRMSGRPLTFVPVGRSYAFRPIGPRSGRPAARVYGCKPACVGDIRQAVGTSRGPSRTFIGWEALSKHPCLRLRRTGQGVPAGVFDTHCGVEQGTPNFGHAQPHRKSRRQVFVQTPDVRRGSTQSLVPDREQAGVGYVRSTDRAAERNPKSLPRGQDDPWSADRSDRRLFEDVVAGVLAAGRRSARWDGQRKTQLVRADPQYGRKPADEPQGLRHRIRHAARSIERTPRCARRSGNVRRRRRPGAGNLVFRRARRFDCGNREPALGGRQQDDPVTTHAGKPSAYSGRSAHAIGHDPHMLPIRLIKNPCWS